MNLRIAAFEKRHRKANVMDELNAYILTSYTSIYVYINNIFMLDDADD